MGIETIIAMIPKGGKYAKSVVNFVHKTPQNWEKFKSAIQQITDILKAGKLRLDGKQKTIFESNKNILKNHEKVTKKVEVPPSVKKEFPAFNVSKEDPFKGWKPTLYERSNLRNVYKDLDPPKRLYTKEMEAIDEELDALAFGGDKYASLSSAEKAKIFKKLQAEMKNLIKIAKKNDLSNLSLSQLNKKGHDLQKRIREIADNPNIKGTVTEGPKRDMIKAIYDSEKAGLTKARVAITKRNSELKYGKKYPVLDPENDAFIVIGLDEFGHPIKMSRFTGKFSATKDKTTGELTSGEGTSFYDKWNAETNQMRKKGEEVFHETLNREGKVIMSNPEYKLPKTRNMELEKEFYNDLSTNDLAKKGFQLKQIDMIKKGREVLKYLKKTESPDVNIRMHEQTSTNDIGAVLEDLYHRGDDVYKMTMKEWITKIPEYFAEGGQVPGFATGGVSNLFRKKFHRGSLRHQKEHDYQAYEDEGNFMRYLALSGDRAKDYGRSPAGGPFGLPFFKTDPDKRMDYSQEKDAFETYMKERFMYGEHIPPNVFKQVVLDFKEMYKKLKGSKKRNEHATGGVSNLFRQRQGFRTGNIAKLPEFLKFVERLLIKASNEIRQGIGKWKGLNTAQRVTQHDNLTKLATEFQKTKKFDVRINEYTGIDAEKAFIEAQAKVKNRSFSLSREKLVEQFPNIPEEEINRIMKLSVEEQEKILTKLFSRQNKIWKSSEGETQGIAMGYNEAELKQLDKAMAKGTALSDAMKKMNLNPGSLKDYDKFNKLVSEGMIGFSKEMKEQIIRAKYGDVVNQKLLDQMLADTNPQRLAEVMGTIDEGVIMHEKGMGTDEIITTLKESFKRKPNVEGGLIDGYATGGVSNLFRSR